MILILPYQKKMIILLLLIGNRGNNLNVSESEYSSFKSSISEIRRHSLRDLSTGYDSDKVNLKMEM